MQPGAFDVLNAKGLRLTGGPNAARDFVAFVLSKNGVQQLQAYGFDPP